MNIFIKRNNKKTYYNYDKDVTLLCNNKYLEINRLCQQKNIINLNLSRNNLSILPESLGNLVNLEKLVISYNYLTHLPTSKYKLKNLIILICNNNLIYNLSVPTIFRLF